MLLFIGLKFSSTISSQVNDCVNDANTSPYVIPSDIYKQNIPYANTPALQSQFINEWIYWMNFEDYEPINPNNPPVWQIPIHDMGQNT